MPLRYAVICPEHGQVELTQENYDMQMRMPNSFWRCPICNSTSEWDDVFYEASWPDDDNIDEVNS